MARAHFLRIAKQKLPRRRKVKAAIKRQLGYVSHNLRAVDALIGCGASLSTLKVHWWQKLLACSELERQQNILLTSKTNSIPERLVNLVQTARRQLGRRPAYVVDTGHANARSAHRARKGSYFCGICSPSPEGFRLR